MNLHPTKFRQDEALLMAQVLSREGHIIVLPEGPLQSHSMKKSKSDGFNLKRNKHKVCF